MMIQETNSQRGDVMNYTLKFVKYYVVAGCTLWASVVYVYFVSGGVL
jgi:hypothetical protein